MKMITKNYQHVYIFMIYNYYFILSIIYFHVLCYVEITY